MTTRDLTPADAGVVAAAIDDGLAAGLGDDGLIDEVAGALVAQGWSEAAARSAASRAVANRMRERENRP